MLQFSPLNCPPAPPPLPEASPMGDVPLALSLSPERGAREYFGPTCRQAAAPGSAVQSRGCFWRIRRVMLFHHERQVHHKRVWKQRNLSRQVIFTAEGFSGHDKPRQQAQTGQTRPINACSFWLEGGLLHCTPVSAFGQSVCQVLQACYARAYQRSYRPQPG